MDFLAPQESFIQLFGRRATLNVSLFRTEIADFQVAVSNGQHGVLRGYLANASKVRSQRVEAEFNVQPTDRFRLYANGAYTDSWPWARPTPAWWSASRAIRAPSG